MATAFGAITHASFCAWQRPAPGSGGNQTANGDADPANATGAEAPNQ